MVDDDVAAVRKFYENKGFFDARVGRKLIWSPDMSELQINFVVDEGVRYNVDRVTFKGNAQRLRSRPAQELEARRRYPVRQRPASARHSRVGQGVQPVRGSSTSHSRTIRTSLGSTPSRSSATSPAMSSWFTTSAKASRSVSDGSFPRATARLRTRWCSARCGWRRGRCTTRLRCRTPSSACAARRSSRRSPPHRSAMIRNTATCWSKSRSRRTASFNVGAGINSNGGVGGNISFEQRNFDITNWPSSWRDLGQRVRRRRTAVPHFVRAGHQDH